MHLSSDTLTLIGAGRMGFALLAGWAARGIVAAGSVVVEPTPSPDLTAFCAANGIALNPAEHTGPVGMLVLAVKPQMLDAVAEAATRFVGPTTLLVSILAGKSIADLQTRFPTAQAVVRAMPNTPAAIGHGITGLVASTAATDGQRSAAQLLMEAVGDAVWLPDEGLMDAVTAVSGSGPAYIFAFTEALAAAGQAAGLPPDLAAVLARRTVEGAAALMAASPVISPATLRENVTSPGGTTAAALAVLTADGALSPLVERAVAAAVARGKAMAG